MALYNNDARNDRTGHKEGGSKGKQGGYGSGKEKCCAEGGSSASPKFKTAAEAIGAPIVGELDVPGVSIVKGSSAVDFNGAVKGNPGKPAGGSGGLKKSKDAEDAGR